MSSNDNQFLFILKNDGSVIHKIPMNTAALSGDGTANGNGNGAAG